MIVDENTTIILNLQALRIVITTTVIILGI